MTARERPRPLRSLVASAQRISSASVTDKTTRRTRTSTDSDWQADAWDMFDLVGEERFLATTLAGRLAQAKLYVGKLSGDETEAPELVTDGRITDVLTALGDGPKARAQMLYRLGVNLFVAGEGWLVGVPTSLVPSSLRPAPSLTPPVQTDITDMAQQPDLMEAPHLIDRSSQVAGMDIGDLQWWMLSVSEVSFGEDDLVTLSLDRDEKPEMHLDDIVLIRVWRPHPRRSWEADSPTRSSLPVLRELVGLTMHISAQIDSRLAGAGLLVVPQSVQRALKAAATLGSEDPADVDEDQFTEALIDAMLEPIRNRDSASAYVPLVVTAPDEATHLFNYLDFSNPLDGMAPGMRSEAIRRLALGQDAPPELLLGTGGMNHWGAWLVQEDVVTTHIEPPLALICDALTTQYLWPVLQDQGMALEAAQEYVIWYEVEHLIVRPNRASDAMALYQQGALSAGALRQANGFEEDDAPPAATQTEAPEVTLALELVKNAPSLAQTPGLAELTRQVRAVLDGDYLSAPSAPEPAAPAPADGAPENTPQDAPQGPMPDTSGDPAQPPGFRSRLFDDYPTDTDQQETR